MIWLLRQILQELQDIKFYYRCTLWRWFRNNSCADCPYQDECDWPWKEV